MIKPEFVTFVIVVMLIVSLTTGAALIATYMLFRELERPDRGEG